MAVIFETRTRSAEWLPNAESLAFRDSPDSLVDLSPLLSRIVYALGSNGAARLLGADKAQVSRWNAGTEAVSPPMGRRIVDLHFVLTRVLRIMDYQAAALWLSGSEPLLGGARPIDVLGSEGVSRVVRALDGIEQGAYA